MGNENKPGSTIDQKVIDVHDLIDSKPFMSLGYIEQIESIHRDAAYASLALQLSREIKTGRSDMPQTEELLKQLISYCTEKSKYLGN